MSKVLLIIDPQYDFCEGGSLPVNGANNAMAKLGEYITENAKEYTSIIVTSDWHPYTHCSFNTEGGKWPVHCVQHTHGAAIAQPVIDAVNKSNVPYIVCYKGNNEDREEFSVFKNSDSCSEIKKMLTLSKVFSKEDVDRIDICGIAGDVCVLDSLKDGMREFPSISFTVLEEFTPSIDGGDTLHKFVEQSERVEFG